MTNAELWQEENTRYIAAAVAAVRVQLEQRAQVNTRAMPPPPQPAAEPRRENRWFPWHKSTTVSSETFLLPDETNVTKPGAPGAAPAAPAVTIPPPALVTLRQKLELTQFENDIVVLCAAMELDTSIASLCAMAQGDASRPYPTFALALSLFRSAAWDPLSPERPLRRWRLIEVGQAAGQPLTVSRLSVDEWVLNYLKGLDYSDERIASLLEPPDATAPGDLAGTHHDAAMKILDGLRHVPEGGRPPVVELVGPDQASKKSVCNAACAELGRTLHRLRWSLIPTTPADLELFIRLWQRQAKLSPLALYVDLDGLEKDGPQTLQQAAVNRLVTQVEGPVFVDTREPMTALSAPSLVVDIAKPTPAEQKLEWQKLIGEQDAAAAAPLASQFNLNFGDIAGIVQSAKATVGDAPLPQKLWDACIAVTRPRLDALAQRIEPKVGWDDIVLPADGLKLLRQIADQVGKRSDVYQDWGFAKKTTRGLGISALFAGESGVGKTMAAEVMAGHLRLNLYRIDLSAVVSKYIGETEKNLRRLFDAAEEGGAILLFDEADALFGKRSEVKDSHDRYANIEINYLLQRMEAFGGLAILATNQKSALDQAFMRRLRFVVNFPFPAQEQRKAIWQRAFPPETPTTGLDFDRLARLNLTGGHIALIAMNAAFIAANSGTPVTMTNVLDAARIEYRKLDQPIREPDFRAPPAPVRIA
jgi:hypothetical protein